MAESRDRYSPRDRVETRPLGGSRCQAPFQECFAGVPLRTGLESPQDEVALVKTDSGVLKMKIVRRGVRVLGGMIR